MNDCTMKGLKIKQTDRYSRGAEDPVNAVNYVKNFWVLANGGCASLNLTPIVGEKGSGPVRDRTRDL